MHLTLPLKEVSAAVTTLGFNVIRLLHTNLEGLHKETSTDLGDRSGVTITSLADLFGGFRKSTGFEPSMGTKLSIRMLCNHVSRKVKKKNPNKTESCYVMLCFASLQN